MERKFDFVRRFVDQIDSKFNPLFLLLVDNENKVESLQKEIPFLKIWVWCYSNWSAVFKDNFPSASKAIEALDFLAFTAEELGDFDGGIEFDIVGGVDDDIDDDDDDSDDGDDDSDDYGLGLGLDVYDDIKVLYLVIEKLQYFKPFLKETFLDLSRMSLKCKYSIQDSKKLVQIAIKSMKYLLDLKPTLENQIGAVVKRLEFVSAIFHFASKKRVIDVDEFNSFFNHLQHWTNCAAGVSFLYWFDEKDERLIIFVSELIDKFKPCTFELAKLYLDVLMALTPDNGYDFYLRGTAGARFIEILLEDLPLLPTDDGFETLQHCLTFYISFLMNPPRQSAKEGKSNICVNDAAFLICNLNKGSNTLLLLLLHDLLEKINRVVTEIRELQETNSSWNNFPKTNVKGFLDSFFEDLKEKLRYKTFTIYQRHKAMTIQELLLSLEPSLMAIFELQDETEDLKDLRMRISRMTYMADYIIDSCFLVDPTDYWHNFCFLSNVTQEIQFIKTEVNASKHVGMRNMKSAIPDKMNSNRVFPLQANNTAAVDDVMVGFMDEAEKISICLGAGLPQLDIVAIVGMAGQGKTTLARKIYHDHSVRLDFKKYAWCCISQEYNIKDKLIEILMQVKPVAVENEICVKSQEDLAQMLCKNEICVKSQEDLAQMLYKNEICMKSQEDVAQMLYKCLKGYKYLIVLDDIWDVKAWSELKASFPDDVNGSRIMITSRIHTVPLEAKDDCNLYELPPLSLDDSLELLQLKLSYKDGLPLNLVDIGMTILEYCKGLPLAIVVIAGVLGKVDANVASWKHISDSVKSQIAKEGCMNILELSYEYLPDYLKPCFLYIATFREDEIISAKLLTRYWIAEGFVRKHENKSMEDVANEYLMDLVLRSLLFVKERSSEFGIKRCFFHDLVRELCLEIANKENFLLVPKNSDNHSIDRMHQSFRVWFRPECSPYFWSNPTTPAPTIRTFLSYNYFHKDCATLFFLRFKLLRILNLKSVVINHDVDAITQLVHLRFLKLWGISHLPSSIVNLSRLEFLIIQVGGPYSLPITIWKMKSLRYLRLFDFRILSYYLVDNSFQLESLNYFSATSNYFTTKEELIWVLKRMPNVRKLRLKLKVFVPISIYVNKLESLNLRVTEEESATEFDLPFTLTKLKLEVPRRFASITIAIGKLSNLVVLKLWNVSFDNNRWDVEDEEFSNLQYLALRNSDIKEWSVSDYSFPKLRQLTLDFCHNLREIPSRFGDLSTLEVLKVRGCKKLVNSVREIVAEQQELGATGLQIITYFDEE